MHRDQQQAGFKSDRHLGRKEWGHGGSEQHQLEAREHSPPVGKNHRTHVREAEADRQIRELRSRF